MTDKEKLEKVRAEIERRLLPTVRDKHYNEWEEGGNNALINILSFIDSLQEEPTTSVWHDTSERPKEKKEIVFQWQAVDSDDKWLDVGVYHKRGDYMKTIGKDGEDTIEMKYVIRWANPIDLLKL